jgi:hypothetical protein
MIFSNKQVCYNRENRNKGTCMFQPKSFMRSVIELDPKRDTLLAAGETGANLDPVKRNLLQNQAGRT